MGAAALRLREPATSVVGYALSQPAPFFISSTPIKLQPPAVARGFFFVSFMSKQVRAIRQMVADLGHAEW